jgi:2-polyprenyl-3-methyl-5-hydroxy-6-metoxy-1,4-benzoquinol methylase
MTYKDKLKVWNSTDKYEKELDLLKRLICFDRGVNTLDYGCGTGYAAVKLFADGFDIVDNLEEEIVSFCNRYFLKELPDNEYSCIYFMHSLAHIPNPKETLETLRTKYPNATITVITPNAEWLDKDYVGDETVIKHFTQQELCNLFIESGYTIQLVGQFGEYKNGTNERIFLQATV